MKSLLLAFTCLVILIQISSAQQDNTNAQHEPYFRTYFSFGAGVSIAQGLPADIYQDGNSNVQIGVQFEKTLGSRFSAISGIEIEQNIYNFDGFAQADEMGNGISIQRAGDDTKYTKVIQRNISLPIQARVYYRPNLSRNTSNAYLQGGLRISANGTTSFSFRSDNESFTEDLKPYANAYNLQAELMIGFKGNFFKNFDLLNASSIGVIYQFSQMFNERSSQNIRPIHFTWRFLF